MHFQDDFDFSNSIFQDRRDSRWHHDNFEHIEPPPPPQRALAISATSNDFSETERTTTDQN